MLGENIKLDQFLWFLEFYWRKKNNKELCLYHNWKEKENLFFKVETHFHIVNHLLFLAVRDEVINLVDCHTFMTAKDY